MKYGQLGKKFVLIIFEGEISGGRWKRGFTKIENVWERTRIMKKVYDHKNFLVGCNWSLGKDLWIFQGKKQSSSQLSFWNNHWIDSQVSFNNK